MVAWNRRVAVVGIGRTHATSGRSDVNQLEMVNEAMRAALEDAQVTPKDIDINVVGDMELFQGDYQNDMWHVDGYGGYLKPGIRMTTGGTTGGMLCCATINFVASGMYDVALTVGFQKHDEGNATTGLASTVDPLWDGWFVAGVGGKFAERMIKEFGTGIELTAAKLRTQVADNASRNPYAHLRQKLTIEDVMNSPILSYPSRLLHLCPQSTGACCVIFAAEEKAKKITNKPVWIKDHVTVHRESTTLSEWGTAVHKDPTMRVAAEKLYKRNGITNPLKEIDIFEMYDPSVWMHFEYMEYFLMLPRGYSFKMVERGDTARDGIFPINPSGGVIATNAIGATGMLRLAEAALQIRGDCGDYQVSKEVNTAMSSSFGGNDWTTLHLLTKSLG